MEKQAAERDSLHRIEILCKNFRRAVFCFVPHTRARSVTFDLISRYAFPDTYAIPFFAFSCKMDLPEDGWKVRLVAPCVPMRWWVVNVVCTCGCA